MKNAHVLASNGRHGKGMSQSVNEAKAGRDVVVSIDDDVLAKLTDKSNQSGSHDALRNQDQTGSTRVLAGQYGCDKTPLRKRSIKGDSESRRARLSDSEKEKRCEVGLQEVKGPSLGNSGQMLISSSNQNTEFKTGSQMFTANSNVDPPARIIGEFLEKQRISGQKSIDLDMDMEELAPEEMVLLRNEELNKPFESKMISVSEDSISFQVRDLSKKSLGSITESNNDGANSLRRSSLNGVTDGKDLVFSSPRGPASSNDDSDESTEEQVLPPHGTNYLRLKNNSRLFDPPHLQEAKQKTAAIKTSSLEKRGASVQPKSTQLKSAILHKTGLLQKMDDGIEEPDPLMDEDLPKNFTKSRWNIWSYLEWGLFFILVAGIVSTTTIPYLKRRYPLGLPLWKWILMGFILFCGRLMSSWIIEIFVYCMEQNFLLRKKVLYFVYGLRKGVQNCLWLASSLLGWHFLLDPKVSREISNNSKALGYVTKVLECFLIAAVIWLVKLLCVKMLASSYHVSNYFERIHESLFNQYVLERLSAFPVIELLRDIEEHQILMEEVAGFERAGAKASGLVKIPFKDLPKSELLKTDLLKKSGMIGGGKSQMINDGKANNKRDDGISIEHLHRLNQKNVSAWNMKRLMKIVTHTQLSTLARSIDDSADPQEDKEIKNEQQAKAAAKEIFKNVAKARSRYIVQEDLMRFMKEDEARRAFLLFDGAHETGRITKQSLKDWVVRVYRERRALALSLNDSKTAVIKLHRIIDVMVAIIIVIIWLLVLGIATTHLLVFISSQLLLIVFVFGNTCKTMFEAIVFLFVMHPFDVGDRCVVDGVQMMVEEMNILSTLFFRYDNGSKIWFPNALLSTKSIMNFYRTPDVGDSFDFAVHVSTSVEKITALKEKIASYIKTKPSQWSSTHNIVVKEIDDMNKMRMSLWLEHAANVLDPGDKQIHRSDLIFELKRYFSELEIEYHLPPQEVHLKGSLTDHIGSTRTL
ncbi:hypothetical protein O6H91_05G110500 [Diphasiastrum complanatum]|uniref:Uncharacterized protein n=6 Tax=Diphasiastrum complanatum TaxID=34168 RepID=A0ACC2DS06_DIPCM|nr:hypothetical protein O6H91_05G110500 [Diphasiastrum complanatum]KAJ7557066.1 hypothetical protein O6H91_05G110500 [Diphasiastrum complanatum]KAJ7557067.1 hypothetical protein O6H91_05G110500 [Diphasiastrum complanatum]KAJ7557068.1 hypothetical protein O6H91_05G110500 [Diphasiastrum complanatum]KAJ7557069.1 hypothetical protein O6H91_05G110500 [Diphasiastrum complanatum]